MTTSSPDPIFAAIGEYQARQAVATYAPGPAADADLARAELAILNTRAATRDGLHAGMCFRIEAVALHLHQTDHDVADLMWSILARAAAGRPVATVLGAIATVLEPGVFTELLRAALRDAVELEHGHQAAA